MIQAGAMNIGPSFEQYAGVFPATLEEWQACSRHAVAAKEKRLLDFYEARGWETPKLTYQYIRSFKPDSFPRKNKYQPAIIHELDIGLTLKALVEAGCLPEHVTKRFMGRKTAKGHRIFEAVHSDHQPIKTIFNVSNIHDADEDFPDSSPEQMLEVLNSAIVRGPYATEQMAHYLREIDILPNMQRAITFGRKTRDAEGNVIKIETHNGDPQVYFDALQKYWATMFLKAVDRTRGIVDRYCAVPNVFTWERQKDYLDETEDLFYYRRPMEKMKEEYPQLAGAIDVINARMEIAYRATRMIISFHPDNPSERKTSNPLTARLDIRDFLDDAMKIHPYLHPDDDDMKTLLRNLEFVSSRRPKLRNITDQLRQQLTEAMPELASQPPAPGLPLMPERAVFAPSFR